MDLEATSILLNEMRWGPLQLVGLLRTSQIINKTWDACFICFPMAMDCMVLQGMWLILPQPL